MKEVEKKDVSEISGGQDVVAPLPAPQGPLVNYPQMPIIEPIVDPMDPFGDRRRQQV